MLSKFISIELFDTLKDCIEILWSNSVIASLVILISPPKYALMEARNCFDTNPHASVDLKFLYKLYGELLFFWVNKLKEYHPAEQLSAPDFYENVLTRGKTNYMSKIFTNFYFAY